MIVGVTQPPDLPTPASQAQDMEPSRIDRMLRIEVVLLLGVCVGYSAVSSVISFVRTYVQFGGFANTSLSLNNSQAPASQPWFDLAYQLLSNLRPLAFAALALYLLARTPAAAAAITQARARGGFGIGIDARRPGRDALHGIMLATVIGVPGLALYFTARALGQNADIATSGLPEVWWRIPVLILSSFGNGALEEIIWVGFLMTRFAQLGWSDERAIATSAFIRGLYHAYQGWGGMVGNMVMGVVYCLYFKRTGRVAPLVVAHTIQDIVVFVGYVLLSPHLSWLRP
jgi:membrane protease YdiL (CAAX protease family)